MARTSSCLLFSCGKGLEQHPPALLPLPGACLACRPDRCHHAEPLTHPPRSEVVLRTLTVPEGMSGLAVSAWPRIHETLLLMRRNVLLLRDPEDPQKLYPVRRALGQPSLGKGCVGVMTCF